MQVTWFAFNLSIFLIRNFEYNKLRTEKKTQTLLENRKELNRIIPLEEGVGEDWDGGEVGLIA